MATAEAPNHVGWATVTEQMPPDEFVTQVCFTGPEDKMWEVYAAYKSGDWWVIFWPRGHAQVTYRQIQATDQWRLLSLPFPSEERQ